MTVISLTTDFGQQDEYVGVMKGVILAAAPNARIVDLCHGIEPQNVVQAAFMIAKAYRHFPPGTLHLLVVDPGVGGGAGLSARKPTATAFCARTTVC